MSDPLLQRYTSDSWSLELTGESSPLSRWTRRPVVKDEHFRLSLLGFETGAAPITWLEGDRPLLEQLHQAIESHVQAKLQKPRPSASAVDLVDRFGTAHVASVSSPSSSGNLGDNVVALAARSATNPFSLESSSHLGHRLHYTQPNTQPRSLTLSTVQLADLLEVLDRWQAESMALPQENDPASQAKPETAPVGPKPDFVIPAWGRIAASAAIALGAAGGGIYLLTNQPTTQTALVDEAQIESAPAEGGLNDFSAAFPQVSTNPSGELPNAQADQSGAFSAPFLKQQPQGDRLANLDENSLPGLESGEVAQLPSDISPDSPSASSVVIPNGNLGTPDSLGSPSVPLALPGSSFGLSPSSPVSPSLPSPSLPSPSVTSASTTPNPPNRGLTNPDVDSSGLKSPNPSTAAPSTAIAKAPSSSTPFSNSQQELAEATLPAQITATSPTPKPPAGGNSTSARTSSSTAQTATATSNPSSVNKPAPAPSGPGNSTPTTANSASPAPSSKPASRPENLAADSVAAASAPAPKPAPRPSTTAARIPPSGASQSQAVKTYFESRWKPPAGLKQPLQYQLILSGEGSIDKMNPLSPTATQYLDQTGIPSVGEPFIPAATDIQDATLVLTLGEDGSVNVSVEKVTPR